MNDSEITKKYQTIPRCATVDPAVRLIEKLHDASLCAERVSSDLSERLEQFLNEARKYIGTAA